ncbi:LacI family DNA-binding transcriptional regulator [Pallidibacillus thermolactis]|jgi:LacI family transcriptional regulator|uniref:LacI family DNA-binding transcriptional regulator n=1 Tax=Pallidibacillus thermolactis TaxID=251051 RepID=UPI002E1E95B5|nr:LacI family DNA-binding transcriptional regulator [Pallidibacillus thermolactis subsp. kokeshiiformis]
MSIRDVAKEAGVSPATVSRVLNNSGYVHEDTRKAVLQAVKKLNYKPNEVARSLYKGKSKLIGLVLPDITNPFFPELARGVEDYLQKKGYRLLLGNGDGKQQKEIDYLDTFVQHNVVGIIASVDNVDYDFLSNMNIPIVMLDRIVKDLPAVYSDQFQGGSLAAEKLLERGCKEITLVRGPMNIHPVYERFQASLAVLQEANVKVNKIDSNLSFNGAKSRAKELFEKYPDSDGIIACNDIVAVAILHEALRRGRKVPEDVQIIGFDDISISELVYPSLSTIHQPIYQMGSKAAELLLKEIHNEKLDSKRYKFSCSFVERETTKKVGD